MMTEGIEMDPTSLGLTQIGLALNESSNRTTGSALRGNEDRPGVRTG